MSTQAIVTDESRRSIQSLLATIVGTGAIDLVGQEASPDESERFDGGLPKRCNHSSEFMHVSKLIRRRGRCI